jgi:hypothetical protein
MVGLCAYLQQTDSIDFNKPTKLIVTKPPNMSVYTDSTCPNYNLIRGKINRYDDTALVCLLVVIDFK